MLRQAIQAVWAREVAAMNGVNSDEEELRDFLFGSHRSSLQQVSDAISWPLQRTRSVQVARSAYSWLPAGVPVWRGRGDTIAFDLMGRICHHRNRQPIIPLAHCGTG